MAPSPISRLFISMIRMIAMTPSSRPIAIVPIASNTASPVSTREPHTEQRQHQPDQRAEVLQQHHRQLRHLGLADELPPGAVALQRAGLDDRRAERVALQPDRDHQDAHRDHRRRQRLGRLQLLDALVEGEHRAEREQQQRDDERVEVAVAPVAERVLGGGGALGPLAAEQQQPLVGRVGDRVHRLREHRRRARDQVADELRDRDTGVGRPVPRRSPGFHRGWTRADPNGT